jgi:death-on-curing protein
MAVYLTPDEVVQINSQFLGARTLRDEPALLAALARPMTAAYYRQADLAAQAAVLLEGIAQANAFVDANKRTATAAALVFLRLNGYSVQSVGDPLQDELGQQVVALVTHQRAVEQVANWLRAHMAPLP